MKITLLLCFLSLSLVLQGQWKTTKGPFGGEIVNYKNEGTSTYVSTFNGFYRSDDEGINWTRLDDGLPDFYKPFGFAINKDEVYLSYQDIRTKESGFVYSNDKGDHWIKRNLPNPKWLSVEMVYKGSILMALAEKVLLESNDKGISWKSSNIGAIVQNVAFIKANHSYFFVSDYSNKLYRRAILDTTWQLILTLSDYISDFHPADSLLLIFKLKKPALQSVDNGLNWKTISIAENNQIKMVADFGDTLYLSDQEYIYKTTNKGKNWTFFQFNPYPWDKNDMKLLDVLRAGNSLLGNISNLGLIRTKNEFFTYDLSSTGIYSTHSDRMVATDSFLFVLTYMSVERYDFQNRKWNEKSLFFGEPWKHIFYVHNRLFVMRDNYYDHLYLSKDQGESFSRVELSVDSIPGSNGQTKIIEFNDKLIMANEGIYKISSDYGDSWANVDFKDSSGNSFYIQDIEIFNQQLILATGDNVSVKTAYYTSKDLSNWNLLPINNSANSREFGLYQFLKVNDELYLIQCDQGCNLFKFELNKSDLTECIGPVEITDQVSGFQNRIIGYNGSLILNTWRDYYKSQDFGFNWEKILDDLNQNGGWFSDFATTKDLQVFNSGYQFGVLTSNWNDLKLGKVKGLVYFDQNNNDKFDGNDEPLIEAFVQTKLTNQFISTKDKGYFSFLFPSLLIDTIVPIYPTKYGYFNPKELLFKSGDTSLEFAFKFPSKIEDVSVQMFPLSQARPGFKYAIDIVVKNNGTEICSGDLILYYDSIFYYLNSYPMFDSHINKVLIWKINDLKKFEERKISVEFYVPTNLSLNSPFTLLGSFTNLNINDIDLIDNDFIINGLIHGSYDPNEIIVNKDILSRTELENKEALTYTIRFQNTGNFEAEVIKLTNDLSNFDLSTFQINNSSHSFTYKINNTGLLEVNFDMIHLPDSLSSELKSHGYFCYSISPLPYKIYNNIISNSATIFFDYNIGIVTNKVNTLIIDIVNSKSLTSELNDKLIVIPNPNTGIFEIQGKHLENRKTDLIQIYNLQGQCVYQLNDQIHPGYKLNLEDLNPGLYFLKLGYSDKMVCKVMIQK